MYIKYKKNFFYMILIIILNIQFIVVLIICNSLIFFMHRILHKISNLK